MPIIKETTISFPRILGLHLHDRLGMHLGFISNSTQTFLDGN